MKVEKLLQLLPQEQLSFLSVETKVDHQVKKLHGEIIFKLILFSMVNSDKLSLRIMESFLHSAQFTQFINVENLKSKYNSIRDRISTIKADYFKKIFEFAFETYHLYINEGDTISKVDSTFVGISAKLMKWGMDNGKKKDGKKHIKYTVSLKGSLPCDVKIYTTQDFINDNISFPDTILNNKYLEESIVTFDRGLQTRAAFEKFTNNNILFVSRIKIDVKYLIVKKRELAPAKKDSSVKILKDIEVYLYTGNNQTTQNTYRLIKAKIKATKEPIYFITNYFDVSAYEIASIYKQRWEIETFFKYLKQNLNLKHIISRNENAVRVMIYMTLILSILLIVYKTTNKISSFKIAKLKFEIELDNIMIKEIVKLCGGDPAKAQHLWDSS